MDITLTYVGGPEGEIIVGARGRFWHFPGWMALIDVMQEVNGQLTYMSAPPREQ
jgi:hypothetical protein